MISNNCNTFCTWHTELQESRLLENNGCLSSAPGTSGSSKRTLEDIFRPPIDLMFKGNLLNVSTNDFLFKLSIYSLMPNACWISITGPRHGSCHKEVARSQHSKRLWILLPMSQSWCLVQCQNKRNHPRKLSLPSGNMSLSNCNLMIGD